MGELSFRLLGEFRAEVAGRQLDITRHQQRCVLTALLADVNQVVSVDALAYRVWGDDQPRRPKEALYSYLSRIRAALSVTDEASIQQRQGGYELVADPDTIDLHRFHALLAEAAQARDDQRTLLQEALALWTGPAFAGLDTEWIAGLRDTVTERRLAAQLDLIDLRLQAGDHAGLTAELSELATQHPLDERVAGQLVLAHHRAGRQADAVREYERIRRLLVEELGVDPGVALQELHREVLGAEPVQRPVPRQLPAAPRSFAGRTELLRALDSGDVVAVSGIGGVGKTWLVLRWAASNLHDFPDGQLYVNLRGFDPSGEPVPASVAVLGFLQALGVDPGAVPSDPQARYGLYRSIVAGRRMLVVLDNAVDTEQVAPLLPGTPECKVVITSRHRLTALVAAHGAQPVGLGMLSAAEATDLLTQAVGDDRAEPGAVAEIVEHCAGLPLALSIVAARARAHPEVPLSLLSEELRDQQDRLDGLDTGETGLSLRSVFSWSARTLTPAAADLFALLGLAPGPDISLAAATALSGRSARLPLRELTTANLVSQTADGRYRMHDLVRLFATDEAGRRLTEAARTDALRRVVHFYLHSTANADHVVEPVKHRVELVEPVAGCVPHEPADREAALRWFDAEHACLSAAVGLAEKLAWHNEVWQLAFVLNDLRRYRGLLLESLADAKVALTAADRLGDPDAQLMAHRHFASAAILAGQHDLARTTLPEAMALAERVGNVHQLAALHYIMGGVHEYDGEFRAELREAHRVLELIEPEVDPRLTIRAHTMIGFCHTHLGEPEAARRYLLRSVALSQQYGNLDCEAFARLNLCFVAFRAGEFAEAAEHARRAVVMFEECGDVRAAAFVAVSAGEACLELGEIEESRRMLQRASDYYTVHQPDSPELDRIGRANARATGARASVVHLSFARKQNRRASG